MWKYDKTGLVLDMKMRKYIFISLYPYNLIKMHLFKKDTKNIYFSTVNFLLNYTVHFYQIILIIESYIKLYFPDLHV